MRTNPNVYFAVRSKPKIPSASQRNRLRFFRYPCNCYHDICIVETIGSRDFSSVQKRTGKNGRVRGRAKHVRGDDRPASARSNFSSLADPPSETVRLTWAFYLRLDFLRPASLPPSAAPRFPRPSASLPRWDPRAPLRPVSNAVKPNPTQSALPSDLSRAENLGDVLSGASRFVPIAVRIAVEFRPVVARTLRRTR